MATGRLTTTVVETIGFQDSPDGGFRPLPRIDYGATRSALLSAESVRTDGRSKQQDSGKIIREGKEGEYYYLPDADDQGTVEEGRDAGLEVAVSISLIAECQESSDGGAEQVGDSQTWRGRNDDDGP